MAGSVNKAIVLGNLGQDPDVRHTQDGRPIVNLSIATSNTWRDKATGERKEKTTWHRIVIFNENLARIAEQYLKKGSKVYVEGEMQTRKWTDQAGVDRYTTEIVLQGFQCALTLLSPNQGGLQPASGASDYGLDNSRASGSPTHSAGSQLKPAEKTLAELDDEIPF